MTGASFGYDGLGRRLQRTVGGTTTDFLYDGVNPVQELSGGTPTANLLTGLGIDEYFTRGSETLLTDALGSTVALSDSNGTVQTEYTYEPFGATTVTGPTSTNPFEFTGRENDETGLYYYRARYYHPTLQRFISEDPIEFAGGDINLYAYVWNSPLDFTDPSGEAVIFPSAPGCTPPVSGRKDDPHGSGLMRYIACNPMVVIPGPGIVRGPTRGMLRAFERQLAKSGVRSLEKSLRSFEKNLAEHLRKLAKIMEEGGHTSSVETEIRNYRAQIDAIKQLLGR